MSQPRRTPLYDLHRELGGRMVDFAGWEMPVQYPAGIIAEHTHCRTKAALFDVSHMGQVLVRGAEPATAMERLVPGALQSLKPGQSRYTVFTNEEGGILDDLIVSNAGDHLFVVVNAGCREQDVAHMKAGLADCEVEELTDRGLLALQGPAAAAVLGRLAPEAASLRFMQSALMDVGGVSCRVSRLGYTGEDGFEISVPADWAAKLARTLLAAEEVEPAGLGARDSLRLEAGLSLYGHDIDTTTTPVEAQLAWTIAKRRREEGGFPGAAVIQRQLSQGPARKLVGILPEGRAPAREGTEIRDGQGRSVGRLTSGGFAPSLGRPVALGYVETACAEPDTALELIVRNKPVPARVAALPFVPHRYNR
ncbi:glycine cleavage system aminomethyltransferase GcvT [Geminicoccaceae bacterium 1502E]|nr:glycine cleavage system aminomethyltransferase GcvT [Geminicoccaceae bacterium 1502E]